MSRTRNVVGILFILLLVGCGTSEQNPEAEPYSDFLNYGKYEVGFKTIFTTDISREDVPYSDWSGRIHSSNDQSNGRNIPISIWYPAEASSEYLRYEYFVNMITRQSKEGKPKDSLARNVFINQAIELGGEGLSNNDLQKILGLQTKSSLNSKPIGGQFPLVIFPNGTSPAYQSAMCEYLASHGYVVAGLPLKGQYTHVLDASVRGLEVAVDDLQFGLSELLKLPNVDGGNIALLANAIESSFCAAFASRNPKIDALVSLEGGFLSRSEQDILKKTSFYEPQSMTQPILAIYSPHPAISPEYLTGLKYSKRYFAHFPEMSEFHFLNFGIFEEVVPGIIGESKENTKRGFEDASSLILSFLNAQLKNNPDSLNRIFAETGFDGYNESIDSLFVLEGLTAPPNLSVCKNLFLTTGMNSIDSVFNAYYSVDNTQPFTLKFYADFNGWLAWKKDPEFTNREQLYKLAVKSFPNSALCNYYLAVYLSRTDQPKEALKYYHESLEMLDSDGDLDQGVKEQLRNAIENALH
ncbi:MAG: hypothetical protein GY816_13665 [Cytophagales bacterium]|nr:hypothetical protein [Cytophagales bacterium]